MCEGFGGVFVRDKSMWWSEPNSDGNCSHSKTIKRLGWKENSDPINRNFVRWQVKNWTEDSFEFDEQDTLPGWVDQGEVREKACKLLARVHPIWAEYKHITDQARAEYKRIEAQARAEYKRITDQALAEYERITAQAWAEYGRFEAQERAEYKRIQARAWAEYERIEAPARADMISAMSKIDGFVSA